MAAESHPFPSRTRPLSPPAPMVLGGRPPGRVGRRRISLEEAPRSTRGRFFAFRPGAGPDRPVHGGPPQRAGVPGLGPRPRSVRAPAACRDARSAAVAVGRPGRIGPTRRRTARREAGSRTGGRAGRAARRQRQPAGADRSARRRAQARLDDRAPGSTGPAGPVAQPEPERGAGRHEQPGRAARRPAGGTRRRDGAARPSGRRRVAAVSPDRKSGERGQAAGAGPPAASARAGPARRSGRRSRRPSPDRTGGRSPGPGRRHRRRGAGAAPAGAPAPGRGASPRTPPLEAPDRRESPAVDRRRIGPRRSRAGHGPSRHREHAAPQRRLPDDVVDELERAGGPRRGPRGCEARLPRRPRRLRGASGTAMRARSCWRRWPRRCRTSPAVRELLGLTYYRLGALEAGLGRARGLPPPDGRGRRAPGAGRLLPRPAPVAGGRGAVGGAAAASPSAELVMEGRIVMAGSPRRPRAASRTPSR